MQVTDDLGTIRILNGTDVVQPEKTKISVSTIGDNVKIQWDNVNYVIAPYSNFTAPTGASAIIVADAIAAFLDTGSSSGVTGSGTTNYIPKWSSSTALGNSLLYDNVTGIGLGTTTPTAFFHIKAGTAAASTAPLKFTSGVNNTTAEAGAIEYDGTLLTFVPTGTTRTNFILNNYGKAGGQTIVGGTASGNALTLSSTSDATKGLIAFGNSCFNEATNQLAVGTQTGTGVLVVKATGSAGSTYAAQFRNSSDTLIFTVRDDGAVNAKDSYWLNSNKFLWTTSNDFSVVCGHLAAANLSGSHDLVAIGYLAGNQTTSGVENCFVGTSAGRNLTTQSGNAFFGYLAGYGRTTGSNNALFGPYVNYSVTSGGGSGNVAMGYTAGGSGDFGTAIGAGAARGSTGSEYVAIGGNALSTNGPYSGSGAVAVGMESMYKAASVNYSVAVGGYSLHEATTGDNTVAVGYQAGYTNNGTGCVFIGYQAGYNETGSNLLYIANSNTSTPLIFGDFSTNSMGIGMASPTAFLHIKAGTSSAATAPLKLTSGTVNTTSEVGAIEYNGAFHLSVLTTGTTAVRGSVPITFVNNVTPVGNVGGGEDDLMTYTIPASCLNTNGDFFEAINDIWVGASLNNKTFKVYFGSTVIYTSSNSTPVAPVGFTLRARIWRTGATTQECFVEAIDSTTYTIQSKYTAVTETLANALTFKVTVTVAGSPSNDEVIQKAQTITLHKKPTN